MLRVEPDDMEDAEVQEAVDPPVLVRADRELPGVLVVLLSAPDPERLDRDTIILPIDPVKRRAALGPAFVSSLTGIPERSFILSRRRRK
jgi:hypothetical protein